MPNEHRLAAYTRLAPITCVALALAGCGGGSGGAPGSTATVPGATATTISANALASSVSGVAAYGNAVAGARVVAVDVNGNACGKATTAGDGSYSMTTDCAPGPVLFAVTSGAPNGIPLDALAVPASASAAVGGTVNLTPLTTMIAFDFLGTQKLFTGFGSPSSTSNILALIPAVETTVYQLSGSQTAYAQIASSYQSSRQAVLDALATTLQGYGVSTSTFDPVSTPFSADGQGVDAFFDAYPEAVGSASMLSLGAAGNPLLSLSFGASGSIPATLGGSAVGGSSSTSSSTANAGLPNMTITASGFTGALAGSSCSLQESGGVVSGSCDFAGTSYPMYGTLAANAYGFAIFNAHPQTVSTVTLSGVTSSAGGAAQGAWLDVFGSLTGTSGAGNVALQFTAQ